MAGLSPVPAIRGVWATVLLDIADDGNPRLACIDEQIDAFAAAGVDGVYCNGTATEFHCQSEDQFLYVAAATATAAKRVGLPFQIGASHPMPMGALARVRAARDLAPLAIQVTLPDWTPIRQSEAVRFIEGCAEAAAGVPLVLYNPPHAKTVLDPENIADLSRQVPQLVGIKCGGGDANWYRAMAPMFDRLAVFIPGHFYASGTQQGAHGAYSNMACLNPAAAMAWARLAAEDSDAALELEGRIAAFMDEAIRPLLARRHFGHAVDKAMAVAGGWARIGTRMMWPYDGVPDSDVAHIQNAVLKHLPEFA